MRTKSQKYSGVYIEELQNSDKSFYITYKDLEGKKQWLKIGKYSEGIRENYAYQKRNEILNKLKFGENLPSLMQKHKRKGEQTTFRELFSQYIESIKTTKKSWGNDQIYFNTHLYTLADKPFLELKVEDFEKLRDEKLKEGKLSNKTINDILATARQIYNYAIKRELYKTINPLTKVKKLKVDNAKIGFFTKEQAQALLNHFKTIKNELLYNLTVLLLHTGARFSEAASLTWSDINFDTNMIYFKPTKDGNARHIFMSALCREVIDNLYKQKINHLVIPSPITQNIIGQMPKQWQDVVDRLIDGNDTAGKARLTIHSLRHTHASWLAISGLDILHIKEQLGHKKIETTMRYSHLIPNKRHEATLRVFED